MIKNLIENAMRLEGEMLQENIARQDIKSTQEYSSLSEQIEQLGLQQQEMLSSIKDSSVDLFGVKKDIIKYFEEKEIEQYDNCFAKFKTKKSVNSEKLLNVIGGDIDTFVVISDVSQKKLKEYAKDNKDIKSAILGCIEVDSKELIDVTIKYS